MIEFIQPILSLEKPKRLNITMVNTLFGAISEVWPINYGMFIYENVEKSILHIGWKPSFLSPYILHLYQQYWCINEAEKDALTIAEDMVVYKPGPDVDITEAETEECSEDLAVPEPPPCVPVPKPRRMTNPQPRHEVDSIRDQPWRDIDLFTFELSETPSNGSRQN